MAVGNYYLVTSLPSLGELGSAPPLAPAELMKRLAESHARDLVAAVLLADDLIQREAYLAGEVDEAEPAVLSVAQVQDDEPLPASLAPEPDAATAHQGPASDAVWDVYFRHAHAVARRQNAAFLEAWVGFEVALRNALATARAKALNLDPETYVVAADLADADADVSRLVSEWADAANPFEGLRALDRGRWAWLFEHDAHFSFADAELTAYAAKLVLVARWHRLQQADRSSAT